MLGDVRNPAGERLDVTLHEGGDASVVVIGHGVTANKDREWAVTLADELAASGRTALRFSFAGNGDSEGDFRACTVTKEVDDLGAVLDALDGRPVSYVGHSMGAAVGVLRASRDERIGRLVSLGGMVDTAEFAARKFGALSPGDFMWDKPECPLSQAFLDDMAAVGPVLEAARSVRVPWLLVHGSADEVVFPRDSQAVHALPETRTELVELAGADHVFSGPAAAEMARTVRAWLERTD